MTVIKTFNSLPITAMGIVLMDGAPYEDVLANVHTFIGAPHKRQQVDGVALLSQLSEDTILCELFMFGIEAAKKLHRWTFKIQTIQGFDVFVGSKVFKDQADYLARVCRAAPDVEIYDSGRCKLMTSEEVKVTYWTTRTYSETQRLYRGASSSVSLVDISNESGKEHFGFTNPGVDHWLVVVPENCRVYPHLGYYVYGGFEVLGDWKTVTYAGKRLKLKYTSRKNFMRYLEEALASNRVIMKDKMPKH